jgi:hypothetical protein
MIAILKAALRVICNLERTITSALCYRLNCIANHIYVNVGFQVLMVASIKIRSIPMRLGAGLAQSV